MIVYGELDGANAPGHALGNHLPSHYAVSSSLDMSVTMYATHSSVDQLDHELLTLGGGEVFTAYRYDEGDGYIVTAASSTYTLGDDFWIPLDPQPVPEGRYAVCVSAIDEAGNTAWTNETVAGGSNPVITVDNFAPDADATGPIYSDTYIFNVEYDYTPDPAPSSGILNVSLRYSTDSGVTWYFYGVDPTPGDGAMPVDLTLLGDGTYDWYMVAYDNTLNHEITMDVMEATTLVDTGKPLIGATTVDKLYINNDPLTVYGGTPPPVQVTVDSVTDTNLLGAAWGVRDDLQNPSPTLYFSYDITNDAFPSSHAWDGNQYFIDGNIVTVTMSDTFGLDMIVYGELDGSNAAGDEIGNNLPSHYAV